MNFNTAPPYEFSICLPATGGRVRESDLSGLAETYD